MNVRPILYQERQGAHKQNSHRLTMKKMKVPPTRRMVTGEVGTSISPKGGAEETMVKTSIEGMAKTRMGGSEMGNAKIGKQIRMTTP